jgi:hypothetical protein
VAGDFRSLDTRPLLSKTFECHLNWV